MGMDQQSIGNIQQGLNLAGDVMNMFNAPSSPLDETSDDYTTAAEERAKMTELNARERALAEKRRAKNTAESVHSSQEMERSKRNANWGRSGVTMSGSKELVRESRETKDQQAEDDALFEGEMNARQIMDKGQRDANLFRINNGVTPGQSTLSLGSTLYKYGR